MNVIGQWRAFTYVCVVRGSHFPVLVATLAEMAAESTSNVFGEFIADLLQPSTSYNHDIEATIAQILAVSFHWMPFSPTMIHDTSPTLRHSLLQSHNKGLYYGIRDAILSRLVSMWYILYILVLSLVIFMQSLHTLSIIFHLLVSFHFYTAFSSESYRT